MVSCKSDFLCTLHRRYLRVHYFWWQEASRSYAILEWGIGWFFFIFPLFLVAAFRPYCNLSSCFSSSPNRKNVERAWTSFSTAGVIPNLPEIMYGGAGGGVGVGQGGVSAPFWSENGYMLYSFWSGIRYGFWGNYRSVWTYLSLPFQMNKKEGEICEFEIDLKIFFCLYSNLSNDNIILA